MGTSRAADNIGTLSVDIVGDLSKLDAALSEVESKLGKVKSTASIKLDIPQAQITRLQKAAELIERIQKAGVPDLSGLGAASGATSSGGRGSAASGKASVNVSLKEADLTKLFRTAAEAAFATPITGVKLDLDLGHIQQQLARLKISFTGTQNGVNNTQAAAQAAGPRPVPAGIREEIRSDKVKGAIDDMFTAVNVALKRSNQPMLQASNDVASKFTALADALGDSMHKIVQLGAAEGPYGRPISGGSVNNMLSGAADDVADKLEEAGRTFYERVGKTGLFQAYRAAGGQPAPGQVVGGHTAGQTTISQQQQVQLAQLRAAEETMAVARRQNSQMAEGTRSALPRSIDDINNFARQLAQISGYDVSRAKGNQTRPWQDLQHGGPAGTDVEAERQFVAGRSAHGPRGLTAFGRVATSQGTDITDLLIAAGPGARGLSGFGEVMNGRQRSGQYVSLTPEEQEFLRGQTKREGAVAGHPLVQSVSPRDMLARLLQANRGVDGAEARQIAQWATRAGGPLHARDLGPQLGSSTGDMRTLSSLMSGAGASIEGVARDDLRMRRLGNERRDLMAQLAGTGVPSEQRHLRAQIANRAGQMSRLQLVNAGQGVTSEQNRQMIAEGYGAEKGELLGIDPLSKTGVRLADRRTIVTALTQLSQTAGEQAGFNEQIEQIRNAMLGGHLGGGEAPRVGNMTGIVGTGNQLFSSVRDLANSFREQVGLKPTRRTGLRAITNQLDSEGFPVQAAGIQALFGELGMRRSFAQPGRYEEVDSATGGKTQIFKPGAIGSQRSGTVEGTDVGVRMSRRRSNLQMEYDRLARQYETAYGRSGSAEHDPMAVGLPPGSWEQLGLMGEKGPKGAHPRRLQPITGEVEKLQARIRERVGRDMGVRFGEGNNPVMPDSGTLTEADFNAAVKAAIDADPQITTLLAGQGAMSDRLGKMRNILRRHPESAYFRRSTRNPATGELQSQPEDPMTGDEMRLRYFEQSGMAPQGGVPLSGAQIRKRRGFAITQGSPALTVPGLASRVGPSIMPPGGGGDDGGPSGGGPTPMDGGGTVRVWITNPFPLAVRLGGDLSGRIQNEMDAGNTEESQRLNVAEGIARGGTAASGGAVRAGRGKGSRINLDEMREQEEKAKAPSRVPAASVIGVAPSGVAELGARNAEALDIRQARINTSREEAERTRATRQAEREAARVRKQEEREREADLRDQAQAGAQAVRGPSRVQLTRALINAGVSQEDVQRTVARQPLINTRGDDRYQPDAIIAARQRLRTEQGNLAQRSLGTSIVQLTENLLGGRQAPTQRLLTLQRETADVNRMANTLPGLDARRRQFGAERAEQLRTRAGILQGGGEVPKELDQAIAASTANYRKADGAFKGMIGKVEGSAKALSALEGVGAADIVRNLGAGFIGGIGGGLVTMGVSTAVSAATAAAGVVQEALKPAYEAAIGYQNVTNKVVSGLSDQVKASHGASEATVALAAAEAGLSAATYKRIGPALEQAAGVEAGNKAFGNYIDMIRAGERVSGEAAPRGVFQNTGGLNVLGIQTPLFGTPSTLENQIGAFNGVSRNPGNSVVPVSHNDIPGQILDVIYGLAHIPDDLLGTGIGKDRPENRRAASDALATTRVNDMNSLLSRMPSGFQFQRDFNESGLSAEEKAMQAANVDQNTIDTWKALGLTVHDSTGAIVTDIGSINKAFTELGQAPAIQDPQQWLLGMTAPRGQLTASVFGLQQQAELQRQQTFGQIALQRIAQPPVRLDQILSGMTGVPSQFAQAGPGPAAPATSIMSTIQAQGASAIQTSIAAIANPEAQQQAEGLLATVTQAGSAIHDLQVEAGKIQMAAMFRSMSHDITIASRQVSDLVGLTGKESATLQDGTKIQASDIGILERKNMLLSRSLQLAQFEHQERALNYQIALAGFTAEGATGEERAARLEVAQKEAQYQKDQLAGAKELASNNWQLQQQENDRAFTDAMYQANELVRRLDDTAALQRIDDKIAQWQEVSGAATELLNTYIQQGNGMIQLAQGVAVQLLQMGTAASNAITMANDALSATIKTLQGQGINVTSPIPASSLPGQAPPYADPTPTQTTSNGTVQIINPSAGLDTASLVRVVISELNRQAGLRGLTTVGGR